MKKGQVTVFVIVGLLLLFAALGWWLFEKEETFVETPAPPFLGPVKNSLDQCLERTLNEGLILLGKQGGYYHPPAPVETFPVFSVPYYFYQENQVIPSLGTIESELSNYVNDHIRDCDLTVWENQGYHFTLGTPRAVSRFGSSSVILELEYPVKAQKDQQETTLTQFTATARLDFREIYQVLQSLAVKQEEEPQVILVGFLSELAEKHNFQYVTTNLGREKVLYTLYFRQASFSAEPYTFAFLGKYDWPEKFLPEISQFNSPAPASEASLSRSSYHFPVLSFPLFPSALAQEETAVTEPAPLSAAEPAPVPPIQDWNSPQYLDSLNNLDLAQSVNNNPSLLENPAVAQEFESRLNDPAFVSEINNNRLALNAWAERKGFSFGEEGTLDNYDSSTGLLTPKGEESQPFNPEWASVKGATVLKSGRLQLANGVEIGNAVLSSTPESLYVSGGTIDLSDSRDVKDLQVADGGTVKIGDYVLSSPETLTVKTNSQGNPEVSGVDVSFSRGEDQAKHFSYTGTVAFSQNSLSISPLTEFSEFSGSPPPDDKGVIYFSGKEFDYHFSPDSCKKDTNCIERNFATGALNARVFDNPLLSIRSYHGAVQSITTPLVPKGSSIVFSEDDLVSLSFTEYPLTLSGDPTYLTTKVESEYLTSKGAQRTLKIIPTTNIGLLSFYCTPGCLQAGVITKDSLLRMNAFNSVKNQESGWIKELSREYGDAHVFMGLSRLGEPDRLRIHNAISNAAARQGLDPNFIAAVALSEGFGFWIDDYYSTNQNSRVNAFGHTGSDRFGKEVGALKKEGYLPESFSSKDYSVTGDALEGEKQEMHLDVWFNNVESAMEGVSAMLGRRHNLLLQDLKNNGIDPSQLSSDEIEYWTYVYYNSGSGPPEDPRGTGRSKVKARAPLGIDAFKVPHERLPEYVPGPCDGGMCANSLHNAQRVVGTRKLLDRGMEPPLPEAAAEALKEPTA